MPRCQAIDLNQRRLKFDRLHKSARFISGVFAKNHGWDRNAFQAFGQYHINFNSQLLYFVFCLVCMIFSDSFANSVTVSVIAAMKAIDRLRKTTAEMAELRKYRMLLHT
jgi:ABC-type polysaccharide transport system permease subunit